MVKIHLHQIKPLNKEKSNAVKMQTRPDIFCEYSIHKPTRRDLIFARPAIQDYGKPQSQKKSRPFGFPCSSIFINAQINYNYENIQPIIIRNTQLLYDK